MTFLELVQRLRIETGIAESGPSSVQGQTRDMQRLVNWTNDAWLRVQSSRPNWAFMWRSATTTLPEAGSALNLEADVDAIELILVDGNEIPFLAYTDFVLDYQTLNTSRPTAYTRRPDGALLFNTLADVDYPVYYEYYAQPALMVENFDAPSMPEKYHMMIVWAGLIQYALFDEAPELARKGELNYNALISELERGELLGMTLTETLA